LPEETFIDANGLRFHALDWGGQGRIVAAWLTCSPHWDLAPRLMMRFTLATNAHGTTNGQRLRFRHRQ
jgi:hypothetical protein